MRKFKYEPEPDSKIYCKRKLNRRNCDAMIFWNQNGLIWIEVLKPGETVAGSRCQQQLPKMNLAVRQKARE